MHCSGRGGGASFVARYLQPKSVVGLDLTHEVVDLCSKIHGDVPGLRFVQGDAQNLPFLNSQFDVIFNVESSHCYPDTLKFFGEAYRCLAPGSGIVH